MALANPNQVFSEIKRLTESSASNYTEFEASLKGTKSSSNRNSGSNSNSLRINRSKRSKGQSNREYCDVCDEGGNLVNCDRCPASFHFVCCEPPLNDDDPDLLKNDFLCNQCRSNSVIEVKTSSLSRTRNSSKNDLSQTTQQATAGSSAVTSNGATTSRNQQQQHMINFEIIENEPALKTLIRLAKIVNPRQMKLPRSIQNTFEIPGVSKIEWWTKEGSKALEQKENLKKKDQKESFISIPRKTCFICRKTTRVGFLIKCDFCPLHYHLDCLNPPLCSIPKDRWMCPLHIENFLDHKLLGSNNRLSERIKLWNKYSNIDTHAVKLQFIKKIQSKKKSGGGGCQDVHRCDGESILCSKIPDAIKQFYETPIKVENVYKAINDRIGAGHEEEKMEVDESSKPNDEEKELWLSAVSCLAGLKSQEETTAECPSDTALQILAHPQFPITRFCKEAIKPRALLYYLKNENTEYAPCQMAYRSFTIGINESCDLNLNKYDTVCQYVSSKHACIYYDDHSSHYELLNYSENGSVVDNILFSNDLNSISDTMNNSESNSESSETDDSNSLDKQTLCTKSMSSKSSASKSFLACKCSGSLTDLFNGKCWEGPAILSHGSHLKFGCLEFIFCIVNYSGDM